MKLTKLLKEVQEERSKSYMSVDLEFETDAHGNLEIWSGDHEDLLAVVDRKTGHVDYHPSDTVFSDKEREAIEAAAARFLDDESDPRDPTAMYADRFSDKKRSALGKKAFGRRGDDDDQGMQTEELDNDDATEEWNRIDSAVEWLEKKINIHLYVNEKTANIISGFFEKAKQIENDLYNDAYWEGRSENDRSKTD